MPFRWKARPTAQASMAEVALHAAAAQLLTGASRPGWGWAPALPRGAVPVLDQREDTPGTVGVDQPTAQTLVAEVAATPLR